MNEPLETATCKGQVQEKNLMKENNEYSERQEENREGRSLGQILHKGQER